MIIANLDELSQKDREMLIGFAAKKLRDRAWSSEADDLIAADCAIENVPPGFIVRKTVITQIREKYQKEQPMARRSPEEIETIEKFINDNQGMPLKDLTEGINKLQISAPVNQGYVNYLKYAKNKGKSRPAKTKKATGSKTLRSLVHGNDSDPDLDTDEGGGSEEYSFDGLLQKIEEAGEYAKKLRTSQKNRISSLIA